MSPVFTGHSGGACGLRPAAKGRMQVEVPASAGTTDGGGRQPPLLREWGPPTNLLYPGRGERRRTARRTPTAPPAATPPHSVGAGFKPALPRRSREGGNLDAHTSIRGRPLGARAPRIPVAQRGAQRRRQPLYRWPRQRRRPLPAAGPPGGLPWKGVCTSRFPPPRERRMGVGTMDEGCGRDGGRAGLKHAPTEWRGAGGVDLVCDFVIDSRSARVVARGLYTL